MHRRCLPDIKHWSERSGNLHLQRRIHWIDRSFKLKPLLHRLLRRRLLPCQQLWVERASSLHLHLWIQRIYYGGRKHQRLHRLVRSQLLFRLLHLLPV